MNSTYLLSGLKENCTGCGVCVDACPLSCIKLEMDELGFAYPKRDNTICIRCGKCERVCPKTRVTEKHQSLKTYCASGHDAFISTSGGIFSELAKRILTRGGCVFGCMLGENNSTFHVMIERIEDLYKIRGSKYLQSDVTGSYNLVKEQLNRGREVLFVGTPCQVAALHSFINRNTDKLITVDIFCHGVPSKYIFEQWIHETELKKHSVISNIKFRPKERFGWQHSIEYELMTNERRSRVIHELPGENPFYFFFLYGYIMRASCRKCEYSSEKRVGDISLGDCWSFSIGKKLPSQIYENGLSFVMCNSEKGQELFNSIDTIFSVEYPISQEVSNNSALCKKNNKVDDKTGYIIKNGVYHSYKELVPFSVIVKEKIKRYMPKKLYYWVSRH